MQYSDFAKPPHRDDLRLLTAIVEVQRAIASIELDAAALRQLVVDRARGITDADGAAIETLESGRVVRSTLSGDPGERPEVAAVAALESVGQARRARATPPRVGDNIDPGAQTADQGGQPLCGSSAVALVATDDRTTTILRVVSKLPDAFDEGARAALCLLAGLLASAMSRSAESEARRAMLAEQAAAASALRETEERFRGAFECAAIGMALVGLDGRWVKVNHSLCDMLGYAEAELLATNFQAITHPDDLNADLAHLKHLIAGEIPSYRMSKRYLHREGRTVSALLSVSLVRDEAGRPLYFVSQVHDVTEAKRKEMLDADQRAVLERIARDRPLHEALGGLAEMVERQVDGTWAAVMLLHDGEIEQVGPSLPPDLSAAMAPRLLSLAASIARDAGGEEGVPAVSDVANNPAWAGVRIVASDHGIQHCWSVPILSGDGAALGLIAVYCRHRRPPTAQDGEMLAAAARLAMLAIEHFQTTRQLAHLVRHDALTGLPNRVCFEDRVQQAMAAARRSGRKVAVAVLDVDHFKQVNDVYGHGAGDALLQQFAARIHGQLRETDTLARMGGDEFTMVLPELTDADGAVAVAEKLVACLTEPFHIGGTPLAVTSSMGIALYPDDGDDSATLQRRADERMYETKRRGRNGYTIASGVPTLAPAFVLEALACADGNTRVH